MWRAVAETLAWAYRVDAERELALALGLKFGDAMPIYRRRNGSCDGTSANQFVDPNRPARPG